jgi:hypothetical protein
MPKIWQQSKKNANVRRTLMFDLIHDIMLWFGRTPKQASLLAQSIHWFNNATWVERMIANQQIIHWISFKHTNHNENQIV